MDVDEVEDEKQEEPVDLVLMVAGLSSRFSLIKKSSTFNNKSEEDRIFTELMHLFEEHSMVEYYRAFCVQNGLSVDDALISKWTANKAKLLAGIDEKKALAEKNEGDVEILDQQLAKAKIISLTGTLEEAVQAYIDITGLTTGKQIDKYLTILRLCLAWNDDHSYKKHLEHTAKLIDKGGDWDRRNRFTVYTSAHNFRVREFKEAAQGLLESIATFSATEIFDYDYLVKYVIISAVLTLPRQTLKEKLIDSPEIIQVIDKMPVFKSFLNSFYECRYNDFCRALIEIMRDFVRFDVYLNHHANFYLRAIRLRAYSQFLESYQSVRLESMARQFGVSEQFLDRELSSYIAAGKLNCKVDKVDGIVRVNRTHSNNTQYGQIIKKGDVLLSRIQRLSRIITY